jgi:hypothetical protein
MVDGREYRIPIYTPALEYISCDPDELEGRTGIPRGVWQVILDECAYPNKVVKEIYQAWIVKQRHKDTEQVLLDERA